MSAHLSHPTPIDPVDSSAVPRPVQRPSGGDAAPGPLLYTPARAAALLQVRESWLRKRAAARQVPCTFLGRHLRFSPTDLAAIVTAAALPADRRRRPRRRATVRGSDLIPPGRQSGDPPVSDDQIHRDGSGPWPG